MNKVDNPYPNYGKNKKLYGDGLVWDNAVDAQLAACEQEHAEQVRKLVDFIRDYSSIPFERFYHKYKIPRNVQDKELPDKFKWYVEQLKQEYVK